MPPDILGAVEGAVDGTVGFVEGVSGAFSGSGSGSGVVTRSGVPPVDGRDGCVDVESRLGGASSRFGDGWVCGLWDGGFTGWFGLWF